MWKKILIGLGFLVSFLLGITLSPFPMVKIDPLYVTGADYERGEGTYILKGQAVRIKKMYAPQGLSFLQEPDGTIHLFVKKSEPLTLQKLRNNQTAQFYSFKVLYYTISLMLQDIKHNVVTSIFGEESQIPEIVSEGKENG